MASLKSYLKDAVMAHQCDYHLLLTQQLGFINRRSTVTHLFRMLCPKSSQWESGLDVIWIFKKLWMQSCLHDQEA